MDNQNVDENSTLNEELEANETDDALDTEENQTDAETDEVEDGDSDDESTEASRARARSQIDRLKEENRRLKEKFKESGLSGEGSKVASPLVERTFLSQEGITDKEAQQEVIRLAQKLDIPLEEAVEDEDIRLRAEAIQKKAQSRLASARPKGKGGATKKDAQWYVDHNVLPDDPGMRVQVWDILAERDR